MKKGTYPISASSSPEEAADWLEWRALRAESGSVSNADLQSELARSGSSDSTAPESLPSGIDDPGALRAETLVAEAFDRIAERIRHCGESGKYPFRVNGSCLERLPDAEKSLYVFLLLLSTYGPKKHPNKEIPAGTFEDISRFAAEGYFGGTSSGVRSFAFGFPRRIKPAGFHKAVASLCKETGEGDGVRDTPITSDQKDGKLDLIVWRAFPDARRGKWWGFGQCAAGSDWHEKLNELQPSDFCRLWIQGEIPVYPSRLFFLPHIIDMQHWFQKSLAAGIVFDRCRIVASANKIETDTEKAFRKWSDTILQNEVRA